MTDHDITALLDDYIGLYRRETLPQWFDLLPPGFVASATNDDGSVTTWTRDEFCRRQQAAFATGKPIGETLENTRIERTGKLACVRSDFVWTDGSITRRGRLMLLLIDERGRPRIQSLTFSYGG